LYDSTTDTEIICFESGKAFELRSFFYVISSDRAGNSTSRDDRSSWHI